MECAPLDLTLTATPIRFAARELSNHVRTIHLHRQPRLVHA
jgi:hypothetical protein